MTDRKKPQQHERHLQIMCFQYFKRAYPKLDRLFYAVPNGGSRHKIEAANLKLQGVKAGTADAILMRPYIERPDIAFPFDGDTYHALCIEFKADSKAKQTDNQKEWQTAVESQGYLYKVIYDFDSFKTLIDNYISGTL